MAQRGWLAVLAAASVQLLGATAEAKNCQTAADCGGAPATCRLTTYQTCASKDPDCPAGSACGDKPIMDGQAGCAPYVEGICYQPHELPCKEDADCGVGFRCEEQIGRSCVGMGTTGGPGVPPSFTETCMETRGTFACKLIETSCKVDSDCTAGLRCQASEASKCGIRTEDAPSDDEQNTNCAQVPMHCAPDGYFGYDGRSPYEDDALASGGNATIEADAVEDEGAPIARDEGCALAPRSTGYELLLIALGMLALKRRRR